MRWEDVRRWNAEPLLRAYDEFLLREGTAETAGQDLFRMAGSIASTGETATALRTRLTELRADSDLIEALLSDGVTALLVASQGVGEIEQHVRECYASATDQGLVLHDDGRVSIAESTFARAREQSERMSEEYGYSMPVEHTPALTIAISHRISLEERIERLLGTADDVDTDLVTALDSLADGNASDTAVETSQLTPNQLPDLSLLTDAGTAAEVRGVWDSLDATTQQRLLEEHPEVLGNLDGIPFQDRVTANSITIDETVGEIDIEIEDIQQQLDELDLTTITNRADAYEHVNTKNDLEERLDELIPEREYLNSLLAPGSGAVLFDRDNDRIIQVMGDLTQPADEVITHVPGTSTTWESFVDGSVQNIPQYMVETGAEDGQNVVGFAVKDGPWVTWTGERSNISSNSMQELGDRVHSFTDAAGLENSFRDAETTGTGHSAGMTVLSGAEQAGSHYDNVISLAGSYTVNDWEANPTTEYDHMQYGWDAINAVDVAKSNTPHQMTDTFEQHHFEGEPNRFWIFPRGVEHHTRMQQGPATNQEVLDQIYLEAMN
ncbi:hypothetical protein [Citricoccus muralis]|uniref:Alpha/beta hydrolase family protein n=1 Tax=Citricoccus muralis TaxID=169134 RepID=A0ABY8H628_9MICC|nr:hypothetical protein [Citricoccus muralis]WFP16304.1 hypothetical protein P8192_13115 [Citricoccus muralis]